MEDFKKEADEFVNALIEIKASDANIHLEKTIKGECIFLHYLNNHGNSTPGNLTDFFGVSSARTAAVLRTLEEKGEIERIQSENDKRMTIVRLTEKGETRVQNDKNKLLENLYKLFEKLGKEDTDDFIRIIKRISKIVRS